MTDAVVEEKAVEEDEQVSNSELVEVFAQRTANYGMLSRLYRKEVDEELLGELHGMRFRVSTGNKHVDEGNRMMATYLSNLWENSLTELAADYMRTFFGHGYNGHAAAYPFESVYTSEKRLLMGNARDEVLALYRAAGLDKQDSWREGEDHIALELEYMQILSGRTEKALIVGDDDRAVSLVKSQRNFLENHLASWVPMLVADMVRFSKTDFYRGLGCMTEGSIETDRDLLDDVLSDD